MKIASEPMTHLPATHSVELGLDGYTPEHARQALLKLVNDSIHHHELQNFSHQERYGQRNPESEDSINKLQALKSGAIDLISTAERNGFKVSINTQITVSISP